MVEKVGFLCRRRLSVRNQVSVQSRVAKRSGFAAGLGAGEGSPVTPFRSGTTRNAVECELHEYAFERSMHDPREDVGSAAPPPR